MFEFIIETSTSSGNFDIDPLESLLNMQLSFQPITSPKFLFDLRNMDTVHKFQLGDVFHASTRKYLSNNQQKNDKLIEEINEVLHSLTLRRNSNPSILGSKKIRSLMKSFTQAYSSSLKDVVTNQIEKDGENWLTKLKGRCVIAHKRILELISRGKSLRLNTYIILVFNHLKP